MRESGPALLLTGATGLVGGALLKLLGGNRTRRSIVLSREPHKVQRLHVENLEVVQGDITRRQLGLDDYTYRHLKRRVTAIIHCAADTRFGASLQCSRAVNVAGTREVLQLASKCRHLEKFGYISTVYVVGRMAGCFSEDVVRPENGFYNSYQQSKYEAEELLTRAMAEVPAAIFRLSSIIGDSSTGTVQQFNHIHRLIRLLPRNVLPMVPGLPDAPIDLIASDWTMAALAYLFEQGFEPGRFYHICAGPELSLSVRQLIELTISGFESHPIGRKWLPICVPEVVPLRRYEEFVQERGQNGDRIFDELVKVLGYFLPHLATFQAFENRRTIAALASGDLQFPCMRDCYKKVVGYCLETNWGRATSVSA